jgi:hypothetical protein
MRNRADWIFILYFKYIIFNQPKINSVYPIKHVPKTMVYRFRGKKNHAIYFLDQFVYSGKKFKKIYIFLLQFIDRNFDFDTMN